MSIGYSSYDIVHGLFYLCECQRNVKIVTVSGFIVHCAQSFGNDAVTAAVLCGIIVGYLSWYISTLHGECLFDSR